MLAITSITRHGHAPEPHTTSYNLGIAIFLMICTIPMILSSPHNSSFPNQALPLTSILRATLSIARTLLDNGILPRTITRTVPSYRTDPRDTFGILAGRIFLFVRLAIKTDQTIDQYSPVHGIRYLLDSIQLLQEIVVISCKRKSPDIIFV
ncbi:hypothetical protein BDD12DRAFT_309822 [Trichophaea hybrida]|nr:hypothetical protein BDD12DRAFT_309822 [Trichophaea hybrida]